MKSFRTFRTSFLFFLLLPFAVFPAPAHLAADEMAAAANKFVAALDDSQKAKANFDFKSDERANWHYIPKTRNGLAIKEMNGPQRELACALLRSGLSEHGYRKATNIMSLEVILGDLEGSARKFPRDPELYHVSIFGKPDPKGAWGWRVEGHHLSVNFTLAADRTPAATPSFFGSNPAEVKEGPHKGLRILSDEEDLGRQLVKSLSQAQRKAAIVATNAPKEIFTEASRKVKPLEAVGLPAARMDSRQKERLVKLIRAYVDRYRPDIADEDWRKIEKAGLDQIQFAWYGGLERGEGHYYRVQGPTFLMEYDNTQNNNNHIHAVWRDFENDFGEDLLRQHYAETPHP
jgi:hypothetical protein